MTEAAILAAAFAAMRLLARWRRRYVRLLVAPYRGDRTRPEAVLATLAALHALVCARGWRRLVNGQPSLALEIHHHVRSDGAPLAWFGICVPRGLERQAQAALRASYPNCAVRPVAVALAGRGIVRLHKRRPFTAPVRRLDDIDPDRPPVERLLRAMAAAGGGSVVQLALTPAPGLLGWYARAPSAEGGVPEPVAPPRGPWFYADVRVVGHGGRAQLLAIAAELRAGGTANRLVGRRVARVGRWALRQRVSRGEGSAVPAPLRRGFAAEEIAALWQLPSTAFAAVPLGRRALPVAPAPAGILRVGRQGGLLADEHGRVTIHADLRRQNTAVVGTVEQGKTSYLVASVREDLGRDDCAVIVLDPKGDAAEAALSVVPDSRVCTLLDLGAPTCGFNPLAARAPIDAIADYVVAALRGLFSEGEVRGSSDRYLRNALIAVLAYDRRATLWDVARLLEVGAAGVALRARVAHRLAGLPEFAEVAGFLATELPGQLADARASTTAKLDAPANKLARVLNSASVKRVLLNDSLSVDFDRVIAGREVLIVRGALGELGAGNVAVLMQLLVGMLDAALSRVQDHRVAGRRPTAVALKLDEAPLVINSAFAQTMALKRSAGLETVACWQTDAQWPPELREQLDALFAHRVLFATASVEDARAAAGLLMTEFSDQLRTGDQAVATLATPDVRLHLPRHTAIVSWGTPSGRERPFIARTLRLAVEPARIARQAEHQRERGGRELDNLAPPPPLDELPPIRDAGVRAGRDQPEPAAPELDAGVRVRPGSANGRRPGTPDAAALHAPAARGGVAPPGDHAPSATMSKRSGESWAGDGRSLRGTLGPPSDEVRARAIESPPPAGVDGDAAEPAAYAELCALDAATRVRWLPVSPPRRRPALDAGELELLAWIAAARCALSSQAHRRLNPGRALTTTQRRLKRLADAGLLARFQLHGGDGGGVPHGCAATPAGLALLEITGRRAPDLADDCLDRLRREIHVVGWLLALEARAGRALVSVLGPGRARVAPAADGGPESLPLDPAVHARDFLTGDGRREPVERFRPLAPAAVVELDAGAGDLLVFWAPEESAQSRELLARLDHLIAGWWRLVPRYARLGMPPAAVVICRDPAGLVGLADAIFVACLARIGTDPAVWDYPARHGVSFVAERDLHAGSLDGWRVPALVPGLRRHDGEPRPRRGPILDLPAGPAAAGSPKWR